MTVTCDVIGIGAALVDVLARCDDQFLIDQQLTKGHMHLLNSAQANALQTQFDTFDGVEMVSGGSAANTCLGVASFGGSAAFMGCVSNDWLGEFFASDLGKANVTYTQLTASGADQLGTGHCHCLITPDGERTMCTFLGASGSFGADAVSADMVQNARLLFVEGYIWDTPSRAAAVDALITAMKQKGGQVALTLSDGWCADKYRDIFMKYCNAGQVDVIFANEEEIMTLTRTGTFEEATGLARHLAPLLALTRGARGAVVLKGDETVVIDPVPVDKLTDATGAGDAFAAGFLYGYLNGSTLQQAGSMGAHAASSVIQHIGARPQVELSTFADKVGFKKAA